MATATVAITMRDILTKSKDEMDAEDLELCLEDADARIRAGIRKFKSKLTQFRRELEKHERYSQNGSASELNPNRIDELLANMQSCKASIERLEGYHADRFPSA